MALGSENQHHAPFPVKDKYASPFETESFIDCPLHKLRVEAKTHKKSITLIEKYRSVLCASDLITSINLSSLLTNQGTRSVINSKKKRFFAETLKVVNIQAEPK